MSENLGQIWATTAKRAPHATAVVDAASGRSWTRAELTAEAARIRETLPAAAALRGRRVILGTPNSAEWLAVFLALLDRGAVPVPMDPGEPLSAQRTTAASVGARWLWVAGSLHPIDLTSSRRRDRPDVCLIKLTSGSTGTPDALPFTHAQMITDGRQVCTTMGIRPDDTNLALIPLGHSYGLGNLVIPLLLQGTAIVCGNGPLPGLVAADCARWKPTVLPTVPAVLRGLTLSDTSPSAFASLRTVISAGAPLPPAVAVAFADRFGRRVHGFYGSSETGGICYDRDGEATLEGRSVGTPLDGVTITFRRGARFVVESPAVMHRGRHSPKDLARLNAAGELVLLGRTGRLLKLAGRRLDLGEVEALLRAVPGVRDACALPHPTRADSVAAAVSGDVSTASVREGLASITAAWKIPHRIMVIPEWPLTARGKTDTRKLSALLRAAG